jgi:hypothetical protein
MDIIYWFRDEGVEELRWAQLICFSWSVIRMSHCGIFLEFLKIKQWLL